MAAKPPHRDDEPIATRLWLAYTYACNREKRRIPFNEIAAGVEAWTGEPTQPSTITRIFNGQTENPDAITVEGLARTLGEHIPGGVDPGWLMYGRNSAAPQPAFLTAKAPIVELPPVDGRSANTTRRRRNRRA